MHLIGMNCCGVREIALLREIRNPESAMKEFLRQIAPEPYYCYAGEGMRRRDKFRYVIFTATKTGKYGTRFAKLIEDEKLGTLISTDYNKNPNTGHLVKVWVWTVDHEALKAWKAKNMPE